METPCTENALRPCPVPSASGRVRTLLALGAALALTAAPAAAQGWGGGFRRAPERTGIPARADGTPDRDFTFCRLYYPSVRREQNGQGWYTDYPVGDINFMTRFAELTNARTAHWRDGDPGHTIVRATDPELYECPFVFASDVGTMGLSEIEVVRLRDWLLKGGFLWVDDFWGSSAWRQWEGQLRRILPEAEIVELTPEHPLFSALYLVPAVPQVPSIQFWRRAGRASTSERGADSAVPHLRAVFDRTGRPLVVMSYNTDIADGWEREGEDDEFFNTFSPASYALAINIVVWSMTH